jgi:hypothetical protein
VYLAERLVLARECFGFPEAGLQHLALLLRHRLRALRGHLRAFAESVDILLLCLEQFIHVQLGQTEIAAELPQHVDV